MLGFEAIPELVRRAGIPVVFSMLGGTNVPWIGRGVADGSLRLIRTRHEDTAVGAAAGYARATGQVGLCTVTRGPGFANSVNALVAATHGHAPILLLVGQSPTSIVSPQNVDQEGLTRAIGAGFHQTDADHLEQTFGEALRAARLNGLPQVVSMAEGMLRADVTLSRDSIDVDRSTEPDTDRIGFAVDTLLAARHPLILAGIGAHLAGCRSDLEELADRTGAHLATTLRANHMFAGHPNDVGLCGGWTPGPTRPLITSTDVVLAVGASMTPYTTDQGRLFADATVIHVEADPDLPSAASSPSLALTGDAARIVAGMLRDLRSRSIDGRPRPTPAPTTEDVRASALGVDLGHDPARGLDPREVYIALDKLLPADRVVVTDSGRFLGTVPTLLRAADAHSWIVGNSFGSIGQGLGAAIGAAVAHPGRPVVLVTGDGGFMMSSHDLDAVGLNGLDLTVVIINDQQYGSDVKYLDGFGLPRGIVQQPLPDVRALAAAYGGLGVVIESLSDLTAADLTGTGLRLVDVRVDPEVNVRQVLSAWASS